ncbi:molybdopterin-guanine dinucleotide biosynthesis protein B [Methanoregula sp.]|uniref:molybdopterin-guanine dinucleotide biosynthesis protein B n=1 Tax=Methanoregula sp. TaxID=2052170 RepID=UPI0023738DFC|nr:molybdopterin-guanine dinucleotide biosynthesis protein B [Methanoregula sp.]MDD1685683.1 molybdopterin-guanine dinucleotide biosynthesis protein B [Methanoregula sp.]
MKIIQVAGRSNSGKTTFIRKLVPELKKIGSVGVIKHLGDHEYHLEDEKDTTHFFNAGADITTGIDAKKTVSVIDSTELDDTLRFYADKGIGFAIIEGYKKRSFAKIVIGNLEIDRCVLSNPTTDDVIQSLHLFDDFK